MFSVERVGRDGEMLPQAGKIHEAQIDGLDFLFADQGQDFFGCHEKSPESIVVFRSAKGRTFAERKTTMAAINDIAGI